MPRTLDFSQTTQLDFPTLEAGRYVARIKSADWERSNAGNDMLTVVYKIEDDEMNRQVTRWYVHQPGGNNWALEAFLQVMDVPPAVLDGSIEFNEQTLLNRLVEIELEIEEYEGRDQNRVVREYRYAA